MSKSATTHHGGKVDGLRPGGADVHASDAGTAHGGQCSLRVHARHEGDEPAQVGKFALFVVAARVQDLRGGQRPERAERVVQVLHLNLNRE